MMTSIVNPLHKGGKRRSISKYRPICIGSTLNAFDTVCLDVLLDALFHYVFRGPLLIIVKRFLTNRRQIVLINDSRSSTVNIMSAVP